MNYKVGIIAALLLACSLSAPARADMSETAAAAPEAAGHPLSAPEKGGGRAGIDSFLDRFAGTASSDPSAEAGYNPSIAIVPPISETSLFSSSTRADSTMNAYYSRSGTDNRGTISAISRSADIAAATGGDLLVFPAAGLAAAVQGHFVGSGAVVGVASIAPMQGGSSSPSVIQNNIVSTEQSVPLPLPIFLTGSGLVALLGLRKRAGMQVITPPSLPLI